MTVTINSIDAMAMQAATMNALSSCFSVLTNLFCLCIFMVCLWFVLLGLRKEDRHETFHWPVIKILYFTNERFRKIR